VDSPWAAPGGALPIPHRLTGRCPRAAHRRLGQRFALPTIALDNWLNMGTHPNLADLGGSPRIGGVESVL
jgi:hypothetical protein